MQPTAPLLSKQSSHVRQQPCEISAFRCRVAEVWHCGSTVNADSAASRTKKCRDNFYIRQTVFDGLLSDSLTYVNLPSKFVSACSHAVQCYHIQNYSTSRTIQSVLSYLQLTPNSAYRATFNCYKSTLGIP